jgi:hypothetical protein
MADIFDFKKPERAEPPDWREYYLAGYWEALSDFGIWSDGVQYIGCLQTPIKEAFLRKKKELGLEKLK